MTLAAIQPFVRTYERVTGLGMVEIVNVDIPADRNELLAIVLGMALDALDLRGSAPPHQHRVKTAAVIYPVTDLGVALQALEAAFARDGVTLRALRRPGQRAMRFR